LCIGNWITDRKIIAEIAVRSSPGRGSDGFSDSAVGGVACLWAVIGSHFSPDLPQIARSAKPSRTGTDSLRRKNVPPRSFNEPWTRDTIDLIRGRLQTICRPRLKSQGLPLPSQRGSSSPPHYFNMLSLTSDGRWTDSHIPFSVRRDPQGLPQRGRSSR
jgi:hypothetical protein